MIHLGGIFRTAAPLAAAALALACAGERTAPVAYVANAGSNSVQVIDLASGESLRKIYSGATPWRLAVAPGQDRLLVAHWGAGTTAVVDLADHELVRLLPTRGPGVFSPDGERYLSFDWPGSALDVYDARTFERQRQSVTEIPRVYDLAADSEGESLYLVQFDPMARGRRERYAYALAYPWTIEDPAKAIPVSHRTGRSPVAVAALRKNPFLLTADSETNGLTLLNKLGDGRAVPTCPAPRAIVLAPDETRMVVLCWEGEGAPGSRAVTYKTDFSTRPWPTIVQEKSAEIRGALVAGAFAPEGDRLWVVDRTGGRLLELDPASLAERRQIAAGDVPVDIAVVALPAKAREIAARPGRARRRLEEALARARSKAPLPALAWTEAAATLQAPAGDAAAAVAATRRIAVAFRPPDALRTETEEGAVRLARGGQSLAVSPEGRFWVTPRQELIAVVYALPHLEPAEAVRRLAGDVPGSPFLRGGLAADLVREVEEGGTRYLLVGATRRGERVAQLWIDLATGRPVDMVEQFPVFRAGGHAAQEGFGGLVETKLHDWKEAVPGVFLPTRLERVVDGRDTQQVKIEGVKVGADLPAGSFELARLAGVPRPASAPAVPAAARASSGGPGRPVPVQDHPYLESPQAPHPPYTSDPPTSGPRADFIADWGVHGAPVPLELQVHNLEHGGVAIQYNCPEGCPELVEKLEGVVAGRERLLLAPYPWMDSRLALTAWGRIETLDDFDPERIAAFIDAYAGIDHHQPQPPEGESAPGLVAAH